MKRMSALFALFVMASGSALAADLPSTKDASGDLLTAPSKGVSWTSVYVGGNLGYGNTTHNIDAQTTDVSVAEGDEISAGKCKNGTYSAEVPASGNVARVPATCTNVASGFLDGLDSSGLVYGINGGADLQRGKFVFGVFGNYNFSNADMTTGASVNGKTLVAASIKDGDSWMGGARVGYLVDDRALLYVLGGYGQQDEKYTLNDIGSKDVTYSGWIVGAGSEFAFTKNVSFGLEYQHFFGGTETLYDGPADGIDNLKITDSLDKDTVMATLKVKLNSSVFGR